MRDVFNFSAGPAMLPDYVIERARDEISNWHGSGMSVMEMSHRGKEFISIAEQAEADFRDLLAVPDEYKVLFLQGGASSQFAMIPMNLLRGTKGADYLNTGDWSKKAIAEAKRYSEINVAADTSAENYTTCPSQQDLKLKSDAAYLHYTQSETIRGVEFQYVPETGDVPLVADMSASLLSRPFDLSKYGLIYAGAQKNIGPAGLTVVIVREDLLGETLDGTPTMFDYMVHAKSGSMYNTPPTYSWYLAGLVFQWLKNIGGLEAMEEINRRKASKLYAAIDASGFYRNPVDVACRSLMNVPFTLQDEKLDEIFLAEANEAGLVALKGHRSVGGMRASIYNAMPESGVERLVLFMADFAKRYR